jgi:hypothetical protein
MAEAVEASRKPQPGGREVGTVKDVLLGLGLLGLLGSATEVAIVLHPASVWGEAQWPLWGGQGQGETAAADATLAWWLLGALAVAVAIAALAARRGARWTVRIHLWASGVLALMLLITAAKATEPRHYTLPVVTPAIPGRHVPDGGSALLTARAPGHVAGRGLLRPHPGATDQAGPAGAAVDVDPASVVVHPGHVACRAAHCGG